MDVCCREMGMLIYSTPQHTVPFPYFYCIFRDKQTNKQKKVCFVTSLLWRIFKKNLFVPWQDERIWINGDSLCELLTQNKWIRKALHLLSNCSNYPQWILHIQKYISDASLVWHEEWIPSINIYFTRFHFYYTWLEKEM